MGGLLLAFDCAGPWCAAALLDGDAVLAARAEAMATGQAERLIPMLEGTLAGAGLGWGDLAGLGVGTGPGSFTGVRVAVAAARGLALGLGRPAVGVNAFEALALLAPRAAWGVVPGPLDLVHVAALPFAGAVRAVAAAEAPGDAARLADADPADLAVAIARLARARSGTSQARPAPLYVRPPDAAPGPPAPAIVPG